MANRFPARLTGRANAHHNPMRPYWDQRSGRYRPRVRAQIPPWESMAMPSAAAMTPGADGSSPAPMPASTRPRRSRTDSREGCHPATRGQAQDL